MFDIQQNSTGTPLPFLMISTSDHITGSTGATVVALIRKNTGAFATASGAVSEIGYGWYQTAGNANDSNTLGPILLHGTAAGCDPTDGVVANVVAYNPGSATVVLGTGTHTGAIIPTVNVVQTATAALTAAERLTLATAIGTSSQAESYRAAGAGGSLVQMVYELLSHHGESSISGTTKSTKKVDGTTTAATFTLNDSSNPTSITRAT